MKSITRMRASAGTIALLALACGTEDGQGEERPPRVDISSQGAALTAQENTERALRGVLDAGEFLADSATLADGFGSLSSSSGVDCAGAVSVDPCPIDDPTCVSEPVIVEEECEAESDELTPADLADAHQEMHDALDEFVSFLRDEIFVDANLESETTTHATYVVPASVLCGEEASGDSGSAVAPADDVAEPVPQPTTDGGIDPECADEVARLQPRLRLSSPGEGDVDVELLLTEARSNPLTFQLYDDRVGVVMDLGELMAAAEAAGEDIEDVETLDGELGLELVRNAENNYSVRFNVLRDLIIAAGEPDNQFEVMVARSTPTLELNLNGDAQSVTGTINYGAINLVAPLAAFMDDEEYDEFGQPLPAKTYTGMIDAVLGGLNGTLTYDGPSDMLTFTGLGLGDVSTTVKHDGNTLLSLDVNPEDGRRVDLGISSSDDGTELTFSPTLDVRLGLHFTHVQDQVSDIPAALLDDTIRLWFEGSEPSVKVSDSAVQVVTGTMHLDSASEGSGVSVDAGMCLLEIDDETSETEPQSVASAFASGVCSE